MTILLQNVAVEHAALSYEVFLSDKRHKVKMQGDGPFFTTCLSLQNDRIFEVEGLGQIAVKEGQFNIIYSPKAESVCLLEGGREYLTLNIKYDIDFLRTWGKYFPALEDFITKVDRGQPTVLISQSEWVTHEIQDIIYKIVHPVQEGPGQLVYTDLLVKTLLFHLLYQSVQKRPPSNYSHYEVEGIQAAGEMIRKNLRYHFVIREIAQKVGMNEFKLKNGFRELFGNGLFEYLRTERMQEARSLLGERARSIKEIASMTGYRSVNSFIKAFKKKFGMTPGEFRKKSV